LTGLDSQMQFLEIPAMNLLSHSHIEVRTSMMLLKPGTVYAGS
jgi:cytochrome c biogenesis protein ResB